jgi:hypothetical protein
VEAEEEAWSGRIISLRTFAVAMTALKLFMKCGAKR